MHLYPECIRETLYLQCLRIAFPSGDNYDARRHLTHFGSDCEAASQYAALDLQPNMHFYSVPD